MQRSTAIPSMRERAATLRASLGRSRVEAAPLPAPGSAEAKAAFAAACREHSIRTNPADGWPGLERGGGQIWTRDALGKAMDAGGITPAEYARLYPLASERELLIEMAGHDLNLGSLFALAYANEYPVTLPSTPSLEQDAVPALASEDPAGDALLLQLGRQFDAAQAHEMAACEACNAADREAERHMPERPACLTLRASDAPLHIYPLIMMAAALEGIQLKSADIEWLRGRMPMVHEVLRPIRQGERSHIDHPGRKFDIVHHPEAQARAEEIVGAWDAWWAEKVRIHGEHLTEALDDAANDAANATSALGEQIAALPARTADGFRVKLRALSHYMRDALQSETPEDPDPDQILAHSLWRDVHGEAQPGLTPFTASRQEPNLISMLDLASASMEDLHTIRETARLVGSVADAVLCQPRAWESGVPRPTRNDAGKLMRWVSDALSAVETAVEQEAAGRTSLGADDRGTRLHVLAGVTIDNDDPDELAAFAHDLLAHAEATREGR
ncbi:hypothetical protein MKK65_03835 [Methylobacterium sp. J-001]|uniref:hypothetical protein n=1 Tax=Methylobacterium sp. J-001 TaxID=2836609 RepID=UPI001FB92599|nr:hypothetical protein [Methylobacterium sp. J-001]MCJ2115731.1 hypothetical protein [Methylobacterium sp. J-001]